MIAPACQSCALPCLCLAAVRKSYLYMQCVVAGRHQLSSLGTTQAACRVQSPPEPGEGLGLSNAAVPAPLALQPNTAHRSLSSQFFCVLFSFVATSAVHSYRTLAAAAATRPAHASASIHGHCTAAAPTTHACYGNTVCVPPLLCEMGVQGQLHLICSSLVGMSTLGICLEAE